MAFDQQSKQRFVHNGCVVPQSGVGIVNHNEDTAASVGTRYNCVHNTLCFRAVNRVAGRVMWKIQENQQFLANRVGESLTKAVCVKTACSVEKRIGLKVRSRLGLEDESIVPPNLVGEDECVSAVHEKFGE